MVGKNFSPKDYFLRIIVIIKSLLELLGIIISLDQKEPGKVEEKSLLQQFVVRSHNFQKMVEQLKCGVMENKLVHSSTLMSV